jgi:ornithine cyclodeaminase/alanine dehydrogenase-like protein (mu-crystallin family)
MALLSLNEDELRQIVTIADAIEAIEAACIALAEGRLNIPGELDLNLSQVDGRVQVKGAYLHEAPYYVVKVNNDFHNNAANNLPTRSSITAIFDASTGFPAAILVDHGYIQSIRIGATGALATKYLANQQLDHVAIIGSGNQAYMQTKSLLAVKHIGHIAVWARSPAGADSFARRLVEEHNLNIEIAPSIESAVRPADLVITAARSQQPLIRADWLKPGVHIVAVGRNQPSQQKLHVDILARADVIIIDNYSQCAKAGEIHYGLEANVIAKADVQGELGQLIAGEIPGRTSQDQITVADLTGLDVLDTVVATLALDKALFLGLGQQVESQL